MNDIVTIEKQIESMIYEIRGKQVMLDSDVAYLFGYETKQLNRQVMRNINRFPEEYCFQLNEEEFKSLRCQFGTLKSGRGEHRKYLPYVFTEYGITMLSGILKSEIAVKMSLKIVNTFIMMHKYISNSLTEQQYFNSMLLRHDDEIKLLQESFEKLEERKLTNKIYFNCQIYDAYSKLLDLMIEAKYELIIIDVYADKSVLDMVRRLKVKVLFITKKDSLITREDIDKYNKQYDNLKIVYTNTFYDRYLILDKKIVYHLGASINYAGSKTFSINKIEEDDVIKLLIGKVNNIIDY